jgi:hypothetical protein
MADLHNSTLIFRFGSIDFWFSGICTYLKFSHRPMGDPRFACWLQGGGVLVEGGTVTIDSCTISGNTAVRAHVRKFPSSDGKMADVLAPTHACTTVNASVNYSGYVPQRPCKFPMGDSRFARCLQGGGVYVSSGTVTITSSSINGNTARYVHAFCSKVPIAPMRRLFTCLPRLSLAQLRTLPSTTVCTCGRDFLKFQSPDGINADALALILACTTATDASVNYRMYVQQRP